MKITIQISGSDKDKLRIEKTAIIEHMQNRGYAWVSGGQNVVTRYQGSYHMTIHFKAVK